MFDWRDLSSSMMATRNDLKVLQRQTFANRIFDDESAERSGAPGTLVRQTSGYLQRVTEPVLPIELGRHDLAEFRDGRLHRLQLLSTDAERITKLLPLWADPQVTSLSELLVRFRSKRGARAMAALADALPRGLRVLQLGVLHEQYIEDIGGVDLIAIAMPFAMALPELRVLSLQGPLSFGDPERLPALLAGEIRTLAHERLEDLSLGSLGGEVWSTLLTLSPEALPALSHLRIDAAFPQFVRTDQVCTTLATTGWLTRLTTLALSGAALTSTGVDAIVNGVRGHRLARLDLTGTPVTMAMRAPLEATCNELVGFVAIDEPESAQYIEHANMPDWGRGRIVRRFDDKIEVEFASAGVKVFKLDAPFLRIR